MPLQPALPSEQVGFDPVMMDILKRYDVDESARQALWLLLNHSDDGRREANALVMKLLKKALANDPLDNASGFIFSSVKKAYVRLDPW